MNYVKIKIKGKNIINFIKKLHKNNIELYEIEQINYKEANIKIDKKDLDKLEKIKTIYEIEIVKIYGIDKLKYLIKKNIFVIIFLIIGISIIIFLSNLIFDVEIVHSNKEIREIIKEELDNYNIKKYYIKKNYNKLQKIKEQILMKKTCENQEILLLKRMLL